MFVEIIGNNVCKRIIGGNVCRGLLVVMFTEDYW
jgi:hypothetical protein